MCHAHLYDCMWMGMDGWMDGWMKVGRQTDGWKKEGRRDGWMDQHCFIIILLSEATMHWRNI